jgi:hypothetical protein
MTAFTPVKRLNVRNHLVVQLTTPPRVEVTLDAKQNAMFKLEGKIERREGLTGDVAVTLSDLPPGIRADQVNVKADAVDFAINIVVPPNARAAEWPGLKLSASGQQNGQRVKSREVDVVLTVKPAPVPSPHVGRAAPSAPRAIAASAGHDRRRLRARSLGASKVRQRKCRHRHRG